MAIRPWGPFWSSMVSKREGLQQTRGVEDQAGRSQKQARIKIAAQTSSILATPPYQTSSERPHISISSLPIVAAMPSSPLPLHGLLGGFRSLDLPLPLIPACQDAWGCLIAILRTATVRCGTDVPSISRCEPIAGRGRELHGQWTRAHWTEAGRCRWGWLVWLKLSMIGGKATVSLL